MHHQSEPAVPVAARGDTVQSVERCFALLEAMQQTPPEGSTMAEYALQTGLPRPVVRRLLLTLQGLGYVESHGPRWSLTPKILWFGARYTDEERLIRLCQPHAERVAELLDESVFVSRLEAGSCRVIVAALVDHMTTVRVTVGQQLPLHATAAGQVLLAWLDKPPELELDTWTSRTITSRAELNDRLRRVRLNGYAIAVEEIEKGVVAAAVPVLDSAGQAVAAFSTVAPLGRRTPRQIRAEALPLLKAGAFAITKDLASAARPDSRVKGKSQ